MLLQLIIKYGRPGFLSGQLKKPSGLFGKFILSRMLDQGNSDLHDFSLELMDIQKSDSVLEIGFGTGHVLGEIARRASKGRVEGIDFSPEMVALAEKHNKSFIQKGLMEVRQGDLSSIPAGDGAFDRVYTANTLYFWPEPAANAKEILRVIKPGGKLYIAFRPKHIVENVPFIDGNFTLYTEEDVKHLFAEAGSSEVVIKSRKPKNKSIPFDSYCAVVSKSNN